MGNYFSKMGGALHTGWNVLADVITYFPKKAAGMFVGNFPAPEKRTIVNNQVSVTPMSPIIGYRPQQKDATTLSAPYQNWWQRTYESGRRLWDGVKTSFMGYKMENLGKAIGDTAAQVIEKTGQKAIQTLPDYFMRKWGLVPREDSGEKLSNTPVVPAGTILNQNETQSNAPATQPSGILDFFASMLSSQPKGSYSIGYPQTSPIPVPYAVPVGSEAVDKGGAFSWIWIIVIAIGAIILFQKVKK